MSNPLERLLHLMFFHVLHELSLLMRRNIVETVHYLSLFNMYAMCDIMNLTAYTYTHTHTCTYIHRERPCVCYAMLCTAVCVLWACIYMDRYSSTVYICSIYVAQRVPLCICSLHRTSNTVYTTVFRIQEYSSGHVRFY